MPWTASGPPPRERGDSTYPWRSTPEGHPRVESKRREVRGPSPQVRGAVFLTCSSTRRRPAPKQPPPKQTKHFQEPPMVSPAVGNPGHGEFDGEHGGEYPRATCTRGRTTPMQLQPQPNSHPPRAGHTPQRPGEPSMVGTVVSHHCVVSAVVSHPGDRSCTHHSAHQRQRPKRPTTRTPPHQQIPSAKHRRRGGPSPQAWDKPTLPAAPPTSQGPSPRARKGVVGAIPTHAKSSRPPLPRTHPS